MINFDEVKVRIWRSSQYGRGRDEAVKREGLHYIGTAYDVSDVIDLLGTIARTADCFEDKADVNDLMVELCLPDDMVLAGPFLRITRLVTSEYERSRGKAT